MSVSDKKNLRLDRRPSEFFVSYPTAEVAVIYALLDGNRSPQVASAILSAVDDMCCELHFKSDMEYSVSATDYLIQAFFSVAEHRVFQDADRVPLSDFLSENADKNAVFMVGGRYVYWSHRLGCYDSFRNEDNTDVSAVWVLGTPKRAKKIKKMD